MAVSRRLDDLAGAGGERVDVVLVTFATPDALAEYQEQRHLPFPILVDADRTVYDAYDLDHGSFLDVWGWRAIRRYWQILRPSGPGSWRHLHAANDDTRQLGGDFVIAPDGLLAWGHWSTRSTDRPSVDQLVDAVRRTTRA